MQQITKQSPREVFHEIPVEDITSLVKCSLILLQAYVANYKLKRNCIEKVFNRRPFEKAKILFNSLIFNLIPEQSDIVLTSILNFLKIEQLWKVEFICSEILESLLACKFNPAKLFMKILNFIDEMIAAENFKEASHAISALYAILHPHYFSKMSALHLIPLLSMYYKSLDPINNKYYISRRGFEVCLKRFFEMIEQDELVKLLTGKLNIFGGIFLSE